MDAVLKIGEYNALEVVKQVDFGFYLKSNELEILLPQKYANDTIQVGDILNVFIYTDSEDRLIATTLVPLIKVGEFAALTVNHIADFGVFMDWGLEKQLFVPLKLQHTKMFVGETHVVYAYLDEQTDRVVGSTKLGPFVSRDTSQLEENQEVDLLIYDFTDIGIMAIVDQKYIGLIFKNEVYSKDIKVGSSVKGYIKKIRPDGKIDLTLQKTGMEHMQDAKSIILNKLNEKNGFIAIGDKTAPDIIYKEFGLSKKAFKKAIGNLFKEGVIYLTDSTIELNS